MFLSTCGSYERVYKTVARCKLGQYSFDFGLERSHMYARKPMVRFEAPQRARLVTNVFEEAEGSGARDKPKALEEESEEQTSEEELSVKTKRTNRKKKKQKRKTKLKYKYPVLVNGNLFIKVPGYKDPQKVQLSKLVSYLPQKSLKQAAKRVLVASGVRGYYKKRGKPRKKSVQTSLFGDG